MRRRILIVMFHRGARIFFIGLDTLHTLFTVAHRSLFFLYIFPSVSGQLAANPSSLFRKKGEGGSALFALPSSRRRAIVCGVLRVPGIALHCS